MPPESRYSLYYSPKHARGQVCEYKNICSRKSAILITDLTAEECGTPHGNNERIRVETVGRAVRFYVRLMRQC